MEASCCLGVMEQMKYGQTIKFFKVYTLLEQINFFIILGCWFKQMHMLLA